MEENTLSVTQKTSIKEVLHIINSHTLDDDEITSIFINVSYITGTKFISVWPFLFLCDNNTQSEQYFNWLINRECRGILLKVVDHKVKVIVVPPLYLKPIKRIAEVEAAMTQTHAIYKVLDATICHLYYTNVGGKEDWYLSGSNRFNVELDNTEYVINKLVINDCLSRYIPSLKKDHVYTFMIRHPSLHPLVKGPKTYLFAARSGPKQIRLGQVETLEPIKRVENLVGKVSKRDFINALNCPLGQKSKYKFGLIIRTKTFNGIVESPTYTFIENTFYQDLHTKDVIKELLNAYQKSLFKHNIRAMLPKYEDVFKSYDLCYEKVSDDILGHIKGNQPTKYPSLAREIKLHLDIKNNNDITKDLIFNLLLSSQYGTRIDLHTSS